MTTLAAVQGDRWAAFAWDSRVTEENSRTYELPKKSGKLVENGPYFLGAAGDMRAVNLLTFSFRPPTPPELARGLELDRFISSKFIPELRKCFEGNGYGKDGENDSQVLVIVHGTVYEVGSNYDWCFDSRGIYSRGSGSAYALGALEVELRDKKRTLQNSKASLRRALEAAASFDPGTGGPIHVQTQHF